MTREELDQLRLRAYYYCAVEAEMELAELSAENIFLRKEEPTNEDIEWNNRQIARLQAKIAHANRRIKELEEKLLLGASFRVLAK